MRGVLFLVLVAWCVQWAGAVMVLPYSGAVYEGVDEDSMIVKLSQMDLQPLEGIWYYPGEDMTVAIERMPDNRFMSPQHPPYHIVLLSSHDINMLPGTEIGFIVSGALDKEFELHLFSKRCDDGSLEKPVMCYAKLNSDASAITFERPGWDVKVRINFARFLPSIFKGVSIIPDKKEKKVSEGFRKIYPAGGDGNPVNRIIYL